MWLQRGMGTLVVWSEGHPMFDFDCTLGCVHSCIPGDVVVCLKV